ncbi:hypothetical protein M406DRAFT_81901 [Cryphonectria parasitica EP155]|uniref:Uncharacterized protein n=1 Tax=Cryphonectria parasitica (strain ATCC 38755 / EP155) TaxID=660469 RepID=A0A9P4Y8X4_CRYP1|nr:uncharacterized protein M406DRAFT_81901 [Cryphonectria parasitica EP155]KAF3768671.1 hypothetical protein M406DRAFT_81901 [Cryphonectria parasitica EP155]
MKYPLYPHQQLALRWMIDSEEGNNKGGILADDMGLGKTISTLALMVSRRSSDKIKTNLIVGPVALIKQWEIEIKKKVNPRHQLRVLLYHGKAATFETMRKYDVVLTSYGKLSAEEKRSQTWEEDHPGQDPAASEDLAKSCPLMHPKSRFYRVILDEAQCIKSPFTYQSAGAARVRATHRWCLTGTPLMNGVFDLWALLRFLNIRPYSCQSSFTIAFGCLTPKSDRARANVSEAAKNKALRTLRILLKSIMLRRMKTSMLDGKALLTLPPKTEEVVHVVFDEEEREFYTALEAKTKVTFDQYLSAGTVGRNYSNVLVLLLRLRQACCHQHLNLDIDYVGTFETTRDQMISLAKSLGADVVRRLKDTCREGFACPICLDAVMDPTIVLPCGHSSCGECFATFVGACDENHLRAGDDRKPLKCPECRGQINTRHVINLAAFKAVHMPETELGSETPSNAGDDNLSVAEPAAGPAGQDKTDRNGNIQDVVVKGNESDNNTKGKAREGKGKNKLTKVEPYTLKSLRMEARKNLTEYNRYMEYLRTRWMPSTKVDKCCEILESIQESGDKTLVFSQFTFLLDLLEIPIMHHLGIKCCRYDGSMSRNKRDAAIQEFQDPTSDTKVMLVSIKAGNSGLNLTAANHVIIMDPFFNYFVENQAIDRAHRIGQRKPVKVYRILVKDTIEDRIVDIQDNKRRMVDAALDEGEFKQLGRMSLQDIQYLFYGRE